MALQVSIFKEFLIVASFLHKRDEYSVVMLQAEFRIASGLRFTYKTDISMQWSKRLAMLGQATALIVTWICLKNVSMYTDLTVKIS